MINRFIRPEVQLQTGTEPLGCDDITLTSCFSFGIGIQRPDESVQSFWELVCREIMVDMLHASNDLTAYFRHIPKALGRQIMNAPVIA